MHVASPRSSLPARAVRPLLKWAGGKRQLLAVLGEHYPDRFSRYVEPFVGSGAVFFDLAGRRMLAGRRVRLADVNPDLAGSYRVVRDRAEDVIASLKALEQEHRAGGDAFYYEVRDQWFNPARAALADLGPAAMMDRYTPELTAMLIFLNRTGFNGLFRLNRSGGFNVPAGRYVKPSICDPEHIRAVSATLRGDGVQIACAPFDVTLADVGPGDFVYCDPPYAPVSRTANFANYTASGFTHADQMRLCQALIDACHRGASVVLSNSSAGEIVDAYSTAPAAQAGLFVRRVPARRSINSRAGGRGTVDELLVTNVAAKVFALPRPAMLKVRPERARRKSA